MISWITAPGGHAGLRAFRPRICVPRLWLAAFGLLLGIGLLDIGSACAAGGASSLYAGPATDPAFTILAPRLLTAVYPDQRLNAASVADGNAALQRVVADPSSAAVTSLATMVGFATAGDLPANRLEFHGPLEQICLLAFARRDGWVHAVTDLTTAGSSPPPTVGLAGPEVASLFAIARRLDPGLATVTARPGEANDLAAQVAIGTPDLLLLAAYPDLQRALIEHVADDSRLTLLPVVTRLLSRVAYERKDGFAMQAIRTDSGLSPWSRPKLVTLCTPVGVVLRGDAPPALREAVNRAVPIVAEALRPSLTDRAGTAATDTVNGVLDAVQGLITRLRTNN